MASIGLCSSILYIIYGQDLSGRMPAKILQLDHIAQSGRMAAKTLFLCCIAQCGRVADSSLLLCCTILFGRVVAITLCLRHVAFSGRVSANTLWPYCTTLLGRVYDSWVYEGSFCLWWALPRRLNLTHFSTRCGSRIQYNFVTALCNGHRVRVSPGNSAYLSQHKVVLTSRRIQLVLKTDATCTKHCQQMWLSA